MPVNKQENKTLQHSYKAGSHLWSHFVQPKQRQTYTKKTKELENLHKQKY